MAAAIGMMDGAYFVGRNEILTWINATLQLSLSRIEEVRFLDLSSSFLGFYCWLVLFPLVIVAIDETREAALIAKQCDTIGTQFRKFLGYFDDSNRTDLLCNEIKMIDVEMQRGW